MKGLKLVLFAVAVLACVALAPEPAEAQVRRFRPLAAPGVGRPFTPAQRAFFFGRRSGARAQARANAAAFGAFGVPYGVGGVPLAPLGVPYGVPVAPFGVPVVPFGAGCY